MIISTLVITLLGVYIGFEISRIENNISKILFDSTQLFNLGVIGIVFLIFFYICVLLILLTLW